MLLFIQEFKSVQTEEPRRNPNPTVLCSLTLKKGSRLLSLKTRFSLMDGSVVTLSLQLSSSSRESCRCQRRTKRHFRRTSERPQKHRETHQVHLAVFVFILFILLLLLLQGSLQLLLLLPQGLQQPRAVLQLHQLSGIKQFLAMRGGT